ncbi:MAG: mannose-1-phosphate guanylyltransferase [Candidatus Saccharimonadales bacterium]
MIVVIIAGGSGTRLWPLSTSDYPKHLLKINGSDKSLLQATYRRAQKLSSSVYVVSDISHINHVKEQLPELPDQNFIVEPGRRGTANCIIAALCRISKNHDSSEQIAFFHSDHYIRDTKGFIHSLQNSAQVSKQNNRIVLVGVEPQYAATNFGYIEKGEFFDSKLFAYNVVSFKEKPGFSLAKEYLASGTFLWNCGYFVGSLDTFIDKMKVYAPELLIKYNKLLSAKEDKYKQTYLDFEIEAIDYALIEKVKDLIVLTASFDWMDLGSYGDLHRAVGGDERGNHVTGLVEIEAVDNSYIENYENKPIAVIGLDNVVVVNTPHGIVIARKDLSQKVGEISKRFN